VSLPSIAVEAPKGLSVVKPAKPYEPKTVAIPHGLVFVEAALTFGDPREYVLLSTFHENGWKALEKLGIDASELKKEATYYCSETKKEFVGIYPIAISEMTDADKDRSCLPFLMTAHIHLGKLASDAAFIDSISQIDLGTGYAEGDDRSAEGRSLILAFVNVSDGRSLLVAAWAGYNKLSV
jgi:hypothetical protein